MLVEDSPTPFVALGTGPGVALITATALSSMVAFFNSSVVNVAVPAIDRELDASVAGIQWVVTGFLLTAAALLLLAGGLIDHFGRRPILVTGLLVMLAASLLCAAAPTTGALVAARLIQGVGAALVVPSGLSLLNGTLRVEDRARGIGVWAALATFGMTLGPYGGGWLVDHGSWRYLFLINVPLIVAALVVLRRVPDAGTRQRRRLALDVTGGALTVGGLGGVMYALIAGPSEGWFSPAVLTSGLVGLAFLAALVPVEKRQPGPMLRLSLFTSRQFNAINLTTFLLYGAQAVAGYLIALQTQLQLGYTAAAAGAALIPSSVVFFLVSPVVGGLVPRLGARRLLFYGILAIAGGIFWLSLLDRGDSYATHVLPGAILWGLGLGLAVAPLTAGVLAAVDDDELGEASAINDASARIGGLLMIALVPALIGVGTDDLGGALASGYRPAMLVAGTLSLGAAILSGLLVSDHRPADAPPTSPLPQIHSCALPVPDQANTSWEKP